jgi:LAO/AO transport system kinase
MATPAEVRALSQRILEGDPRALARAATLAVNQPAVAEELKGFLSANTGRAMTIGITGAPGVGKSTLVDQLTRTLRSQGKTVGIVAVDPSSPFSHGAILGDRIRMQRHHDDPGVFIRSLASRGKSGGLAEGAREVALLLAAAGRDVVLIETVGVGQEEVEIARAADVTVLVLVPGLGDDVQAMKAGIMEVADVFAINKSDMPGADRLEQDIRMMQSLGGEEERSNAAPVRRVVASDGTGIEDLLAAIRDVFQNRK